MTPAPDTIAAIATPPGRGGIGVVRVSGAAVPAIAAALVAQPLAPRVATLATFRDARGEPLDQGLALYFSAPHSYTGEHVLELHGHGGPAVLRLLLARCLELGARLAQPGEFTQRAFLNGKLDLAQAEAVADLIDAATATAARAAARSLSGAFSRRDPGARRRADRAAHVHRGDARFPRRGHRFPARRRCARQARRDPRAASPACWPRRGRARCCATGSPWCWSASRTSASRASSTACPARTSRSSRRFPARRATRSRAQIEISGIPLTIIDTAGLRPTDDPIETLGIERTWAAVQRADLALVMVDARAAGDGGGSATAAILAQMPAALPRIIVHNKIDLCADEADRAARVEIADADGVMPPLRRRHVFLSAKTGAGVDALRREILAQAGAQEEMEGAFLARERHLGALRDADAHLAAAADHLAQARAAARAASPKISAKRRRRSRRSPANSPQTTCSA